MLLYYYNSGHDRFLPLDQKNPPLADSIVVVADVLEMNAQSHWGGPSIRVEERNGRDGFLDSLMVLRKRVKDPTHTGHTVRKSKGR